VFVSRQNIPICSRVVNDVVKKTDGLAKTSDVRLAEGYGEMVELGVFFYI
jgi:hypothetical protein